MKKKFKKSDVVLVCGATINETGIKSIHRGLAKVVEVGKYDMFVHTLPKGEYTKPYRIPLTRCQIIDLHEKNLLDTLTEPEIGDLVVSITHHFGKVQHQVGTIKEIVNKPGDLKHAVLTHSTQEFKVAFNTIIVLEN